MFAKSRRTVGPVLALLTLAFATNRQLPAVKAGSNDEPVAAVESNSAVEAQEAKEFFALKRAPVGQTAVPSERYATARQRADKMNVYSTASGIFKPRGGEVGAATPNIGTWSSLGPGNIGGRTRAIAVDPNGTTWYAGGVAGGVFKTTNSGLTIAPVGDSTLTNMAVTALVLKPGTPATILAGTGEGFSSPNNDAVRGAGIFQSTDSGATWAQIASTNNSSFYYVNDIVISSATFKAYAATSTGVWSSPSPYSAWTKILAPTGTGAGCLDLALRADPGVNDWLLASCGISGGTQSIYLAQTAQTATTIANWSVTLSETQMGRTSLSFGPSLSGVAYAMAADKTSGALYAVWKSTTDGQTAGWIKGANGATSFPNDSLILEEPQQKRCSAVSVAQGAYDNVIAADPSVPNVVWAGGVDLFRSADGGVTFQPVSSGLQVGQPHYLHPNQHAIVFNPVGGNMIIGNDGGIFERTAGVGAGSFDPCPAGGVTTSSVYASRNNGYSVTQFNSGAVLPDDKSYLGGAQGNGTVKGTDAGGPNAWTQVYRGGEGGNVAIDPTNTNVILLSNTKATFRKSLDGGATFANNSASSPLWNTGISDSSFLLVAPLVTDPTDAQRLWTAGARLWRSDDQGDTWTQASAAAATSVSAIAVAPSDPNFVLAGTQAGVIHRTAIGLTSTSATIWASVTPRAGYVSSIAFEPTNTSVAYATYSTFGGIHVYKTINGGLNWTDADGTGVTGIPDIPVHSIAIDPLDNQRLYAGTDLGVFVSLNGGSTWAVENTGFANVITESLVVNGANLYAFTHGRGAWRVALTSAASTTTLDFTTIRTTVTEAATSVPLGVTLRTANHAATSGPITVNYATANGTATAGSDYTTTTGTLTFPTGTLHGATQTINVPILQDTAGELSETLTVSLSGATGGALLGQKLHTITIKDDGDPPGLSINDVAVSEATALATFTVTLSPAALVPVTVAYATADSTAVAGTTGDYTATSGVLTFAAGITSKTFTVAIKNDTVAEPAETFFVNLSAPTGGAAITDAQGVGTINDNDVSGTIQFSASSYTVTEAGIKATITATRTGGTASGVTVDYQTSNGTAVAPGDYTATSGTLGFGTATSITFTVNVTNDTLDESDETVNLTLLNPVGYGAVLNIPQSTALLTITDNDVAGTLAFSAATYTAVEGNSALITVKRTGGAASGVTVNYATSDGTAKLVNLPDPPDYTATSGTLTFAANETSKTFSVPLLAESPIVVEGDETVNLTLSLPTGGGTLDPVLNVAVLTVQDASPKITFAAASVTVGENLLSVKLNVSRQGPTTTAVTVPYSTADGSAKTTTVGADPLDYTAASGTLTFAAGVITQTITVVLKPDTLVEGPQNFTVNLGTPTGGLLGAFPTETVNITDDDLGGVFAFSAATFSVNEPLTAPGTAAAKATVTVKRTSGTASGVTVHWSTSDGTALAPADYTAASGTLTFAAGITSQSFTVNVPPDDIVEGYETFGVTLDTPTGGSSLVAVPTATVTIVDSEPVVQFSAATYTFSEGVALGKATISLKRTGSLVGALVVNLSHTPGTATYGAGGDYNNVPATVTMPASAATKTFTFDILQDLAVELTPETLSLTVASCTGTPGCTVGPQATTAVTITDDEPVVTWTLASYTVGEATPKATLTLKRTGSLALPVDVTLVVLGGTATAGSDYNNLPLTVTMPAGLATKAFTIDIVNDLLGELNETLQLQITNATGGSVGALNTTTLTITDNEPTITLSAASYVVAEPLNVTPFTPIPLTITVKRTGILTQISTVDYTIVGGTATAGVDYTLTAPTVAAGTLTFASGVASMTLKLATVHDLIDDNAETILVTLSNVAGAKLGAALPATLSATVTITDND